MPKQKELAEQITMEKDLLVGLQRKRDYGMDTDHDRKEIQTRLENLSTLEKSKRKMEQNKQRQKKHRAARKRKFEALDENTRKKIFGKANLTPGAPKKVENEELIQAIARIAIHGSAAHDNRRNEVIRTVKTLDQLTEALQKESEFMKT